MASLLQTNQVMDAIKASFGTYLHKQIEELIEQELENVHARVVERARGKVGSIVTKIFEKMSFERFGSELVIRVQIEEPSANTTQGTPACGFAPQSPERGPRS